MIYVKHFRTTTPKCQLEWAEYPIFEISIRKSKNIVLIKNIFGKKCLVDVSGSPIVVRVKLILV